MNKFKNSLVVKFLFVVMLTFSFQVISIIGSNEALAADPACTFNGDAQIDSSDIITGAGRTKFCTKQPETLRMFPIGAWACTAKPVAPTTSTAIDLSNCVQILSADGTSSVDISTVGDTVPFSGGTLTIPGVGIYTHIVLEADSVFGLKGNVVSDDTTVVTGSIAGAGVANAAGEFCWTVAGSYINTSKANMDCGDTLGATYGIALVDMVCMDDACSKAGSSDNEVDGAVPGSDWQYSSNNSGNSGNVKKFDVTGSDGVTRSTEYYVMNRDTRVLCSQSTCLAADNTRAVGVTTSMVMAQALPQAVGNNTETPSKFDINFKLGTSQLIDTSRTVSGANVIATRMGPVAVEFILTYNRAARTRSWR